MVSAALAGWALPLLWGLSAAPPASGPIHVGGRLELFVDTYLIERFEGGARLQLHRPVPREIVFRTDAPWEGNASAYQSVVSDGGHFRMYYRGGHYKHGGEPAHVREPHAWVLCCAESEDGIHWHRPRLGVCAYDGSKDNNIVVDTQMLAAIEGDPAHTAVFLDRNPECPADARYKIIVLGRKPRRGLFVMGSPDGYHFRLLSTEPIQTEGAFDSQNLVFWDAVREEYRMYHRGFNKEVRDVLTAVSRDILHFPKPEWLQYPGSPVMALYTNQIQPYFRAPHIFMGFPMRYCDRGWSIPMLDLPGAEVRIARARHSRRYGTTVTDAVFMTSRDGLHFHRWSEAFLRPGPKRSDSWVYGDNFIFWGMVETRSVFDDAPPEISFYATEGYWEGAETLVRRYTLRLDGFVSATAPYSGGEVVTRPLVFSGGALALNIETSAFGSVQVEVQQPDGTPVPGFSLNECPPIFCDRVRHLVRWRYNDGDLRPLAGKPVRLRFLLRDADLYAFQFVPFEPSAKHPDLAGTGFIPAKDPARKPFTAVDDDFSSVDAGVSPTAADLDPAGSDGGTGWFVAEGSADRVQVLCDDPIGSGKPGEDHYMKVERRNESMRQGGRAYVRFSPRDAADTTDGVIELDARIMVPSTVKYCADIDAYDNPPDEYANRAFQVRFFPDGTVRYWRDTHVKVEGVTHKPDAWNHVHIRADLKTGTFDLTVNEHKTTDLPFGTPGVRRVQCIAFAPNTNNCVMYVDRVTVKVVPEPVRKALAKDNKHGRTEQ